MLGLRTIQAVVEMEMSPFDRKLYSSFLKDEHGWTSIKVVRQALLEIQAQIFGL